jgi:hypothetical protein
MLAHTAVRIFEQRRAVEPGEAKGIAGEMGGDPVQDDPDALLMQMVNEKLKIGRRAIAAGHAVVARHLITPGSISGCSLTGISSTAL